MCAATAALQPEALAFSSMSCSSPTALGSRSSSPETPESSHCLEPVAIHHEAEISSWFHSMHPKPLSMCAAWDLDGTSYMSVSKDDETQMLPLNDLIQEHLYDE